MTIVWWKFRQHWLWSWHVTRHRFKGWCFRNFGPIFLELSTKNDGLIFIDPAVIKYFTFYDCLRNFFDMCTNTSHIKVKHGTTGITFEFWIILTYFDSCWIHGSGAQQFSCYFSMQYVRRLTSLQGCRPISGIFFRHLQSHRDVVLCFLIYNYTEEDNLHLISILKTTLVWCSSAASLVHLINR